MNNRNKTKSFVCACEIEKQKDDYNYNYVIKKVIIPKNKANIFQQLIGKQFSNELDYSFQFHNGENIGIFYVVYDYKYDKLTTVDFLENYINT